MYRKIAKGKREKLFYELSKRLGKNPKNLKKKVKEL